MELNEISSISKIRTLQKKEEVVATAPLKDKVTRSPEAIEAQKKAYFVALLNEMPEAGIVEKTIAKKLHSLFFPKK